MKAVAPLVGLAVLAPFVIGFAVGGNDGSGTPVFRFEDPDIVESSGLVARDGLFVTVNDSGDTGRVFAVDARGATVGVTSWGEAVDVEAVAPDGPGQVLVGDIGDNLGVRDSVRIVRVPVGAGDRDDPGTGYDLVYPDGAQDAETLMVQPRSGRIVVVTKGVFGGRVMLAPRTLRADAPNRLTEVGSAIGVATDGAFFPDGKHLVVRDYSRAVVYTWPGLDEVGGFDLPAQPQGEGIAVDGRDRVYVSSEGSRSEVLRVRLPGRVTAALESATPSPGTSSTPAPDGSAAPANDPDASRHRGVQWPYVVAGLVLIALPVLLLVIVVELVSTYLRRRRAR